MPTGPLSGAPEVGARKGRRAASVAGRETMGNPFADKDTRRVFSDAAELSITLMHKLALSAKSALSPVLNFAREFADDAYALRHKGLMLLGLILIPSLLFFLYVGAYYKPLDNMTNTELFIVNMDGSEASLDVENAIIASNTYSFSRANYDYAMEKISEGSAWGAVVIPPDFGKRLAAGAEPKIDVFVEEQQSYIVARVLKPTFTVLSDRLNAKISSSALSSASGALATLESQDALTSSQLSSLSSGSRTLSGAEGKVGSSLHTISSGGAELAASQKEIAEGTKTAAYSMDALHNGLFEIREGAGTIRDSLALLGNGAGKIMQVHAAESAALSQAASLAAEINSTSPSNSTSNLIAAIGTASKYSSAEGSAFSMLNSSIWQLQGGASALYSGADKAYFASGEIENGLFRLYPLQLRVAEGAESASLGSKALYGASTQIREGQEKITSSASLLSGKQSKLASSQGEASEALSSVPQIILSTHEYAQNDYGTFFATAFSVLGLFFGAASAYLFSALSKVRRPLLFALMLVLIQSVMLLFVYDEMGFPHRDGLDSLLFSFLASAAVFVLLTRCIVFICSPSFEAHHLQLYSPIFSLLAVFMISAGGAIWPSHTLNGFFSQLAPYIPMNYGVQAVRASALGGTFPLANLEMLALFGFVFVVLPGIYFGIKGRLNSLRTIFRAA